MAKRSGNKKSSKAGRSPSAKPKTRKQISLFAQVQAVVAKTNQLKRNADNLAQESANILESATIEHEKIERVHHSVDKAHRQIRDRGRQLAAKRNPVSKPDQSREPLLVVGVGASAGGFEAFIQLLEQLSPETGMAFVFVQHLDPVHESKLSSLLGRTTRMKVVEIRDKTPLAPDHIYVIPPNKTLLISNGVLELVPRRKNGIHLPIDLFFQSLARDQGNRAIGIVLSGNANDGTAGLQAIKAEGGITIAQDAKSAKFPSMPESASAAGCVDYVLSPAAIAGELERIARHGGLRNGRSKSSEPILPGTDQDLTLIFSLLRLNTGVDFSHYKLTTLKRRVLRRMVLKKAESLRDYLAYLKQHSQEVEALFQDVLINVTNFFRDPGAFQMLKKKCFPAS